MPLKYAQTTVPKGRDARTHTQLAIELVRSNIPKQKVKEQFEQSSHTRRNPLYKGTTDLEDFFKN